VEILGEVDSSHTAFAQLLENSVMGEGLANRCGSEDVELRANCALTDAQTQERSAKLASKISHKKAQKAQNGLAKNFLCLMCLFVAKDYVHLCG